MMSRPEVILFLCFIATCLVSIRSLSPKTPNTGTYNNHIQQNNKQGSIKNNDDIYSERRQVFRTIKNACGFSAFSTLVMKDNILVPAAGAFDGGVGGLGKVKPNTGIVFRDSDTSPRLVTAAGSGRDVVTNELVGPDGTIALVSFEAPWPMLQSSGQIESRDLQQPESAFIQVAELPKTLSKDGTLPSKFYSDVIFGGDGKFGKLIVTYFECSW